MILIHHILYIQSCIAITTIFAFKERCGECRNNHLKARSKQRIDYGTSQPSLQETWVSKKRSVRRANGQIKSIIKCNIRMLGIDPKIWGSSGWAILHRMSFHLHDMDISKRFFMSLQHILPCMKCRQNYAKHISQFPFPKRAKDVAKWLYNIHRKIHNSVNSTSQVPSFATVTAKYSSVIGIQPDEWTFIYSILSTHPGVHKASETYKDALLTFLTIWSQHAVERRDIESKKSLERWIFKISGEKPTKRISKCDTDYCTL